MTAIGHSIAAAREAEAANTAASAKTRAARAKTDAALAKADAAVASVDAARAATIETSAAPTAAPAKTILTTAKAAAAHVTARAHGAAPLPDVEAIAVPRLATGIGEFDRVLGGGLVPGSLVLLGGDPGIGKSTLLLQSAAELARRGGRVLYVTSEESAFQTKLRAERLFPADDGAGGVAALEGLYILADTNLPRIAEQARAVAPDVMVIDSIQMVYSPGVEAAPGSVSQIRRCGADLVQLAKTSGVAVVLVGHVTKDGQLAGPRLLEHLVDAVLSFEGDRHHAYRVVRGVKNRYGTTLEVGLFEMTGAGLSEVADPSAAADPEGPARPGAVVCPAVHGARALLVEVQALTATGVLGAAKRKVSGVDSSRLAMLIAVLEKHGGQRLADQDVFVSTAGGLKVAEPGADLAIALAVGGAHIGRAVPRGCAVIGEVGLGGEVRAVSQFDRRAREASRRGFSTVIASMAHAEGASAGGLAVEVVGVRTVTDALGLLA